jgi:23S rRNA pseudouridine2605 synthase
MPEVAAIEQAQGLLTRLVASGSVVGLNLLGAVSEQPDFLAHSQALPYVLCLRADADWKHAPQKSSGHKVSPLVLELWKALDKEGVLSAAEAREILGREVTEAAVLRALCELWQALRVSPVFADPGQPARWELLRVRHREALATASTTSQVTALSLLVSMYLQSVYAASSEEIEIFLSPVASRSRVREAVRGLSATRQIHSLSMDAQTYYFLEGGLPEFAEVAAAPAVRAETPRPAAGTAPRVETPRQPLPAQRKDWAAKPIRRASPSGRPPNPAPAAPRSKSESRPKFKSEPRPESRPAAAPAKTEWTGPRRPAAQWRAGGKPPAAGARGPGKDGSSRSSGPPGRSFSPKTAGEPGRSPGTPRTATRPDSRGQARPDRRPGAWSGAQKRERPAPWARPGQGAASGARAPRAGGRGDSPFRSEQKPRPESRGESRGGAGGGPVRGLPSGGPSGGRPPGRIPGGRPPARRPEGRRPEGRRPEGRPQGSAPAAAGNRPWTANRPLAAGRPSSRAGVPFRSGPGRSGPAVPRSGPPRDAGRGAESVSGRGPAGGASRDRPRSGGYAKRGATSGSGRGDQAARPPFAAGSRPAKPWLRTGAASGKPGGRRDGKPGGRPSGKTGKPPARFGGGKPARKKPGV